jgi:hypothetical protein
MPKPTGELSALALLVRERQELKQLSGLTFPNTPSPVAETCALGAAGCSGLVAGGGGFASSGMKGWPSVDRASRVPLLDLDDVIVETEDDVAVERSEAVGSKVWKGTKKLKIQQTRKLCETR